MANPRLDQVRSLIAAGRLDQALALCTRLVRADAADPFVNNSMSHVLVRLGRAAEALHYAEVAAKLRPDEPAFQADLGRLLAINLRDEEALSVLRRAVGLAPKHVAARRVLAGVLSRRLLWIEAAEQCREGLRIAPDDSDLLLCLTGALLDGGRPEEADEALRRAIVLRPRDPSLLSAAAFLSNYLPGASADDVMSAHRRYAAALGAPAVPTTRPPPRPTDQGSIRLGFVSPDLRRHSVAFFLEPLFEHLSRERFSIAAYSTNTVEDDVTRRLRAHASSWRIVAHESDAKIAEIIRADRVDILFDLAGHTAGQRLGIFMLRPAPVQVAFLGYVNTTGLSCFDARIVDSVTDPMGAEAFATEPLVRLDPCYLCYRPPEEAPDVSPAPCRDTGFVTFGSFNSFQKLNARTVKLWAGVLRAVPASRLLLKGGADDPALRADIAARFAAHGVDASRVELLPRTRSIVDHLAAYARVDIGLDTIPFTGVTTTCEALWMGVPVVTLPGGTHPARLCASILTAIGLPELIAADDASYIAVAAGLASNPPGLADLRATMRPRIRSSPLCDAPAYARRFEQAMSELWNARSASGGEV